MSRISADEPIERIPSDEPVVAGSVPAALARKGRGAVSNLAHRFESVQRMPDAEPRPDDDEELPPLATTVTLETARSIITRNDSPDIGFDRSINPYRGCEHGCIYCYARPTHEYLSFRAGSDFDTKIVVKRNAAALLRAAFDKPSWKGEPVMFSGVTDCYQPAERKFELTRGCLKVASEAGQPVCIVTKNALVLRDLDILSSMAERNLDRILGKLLCHGEVRGDFLGRVSFEIPDRESLEINFQGLARGRGAQQL